MSSGISYSNTALESSPKPKENRRERRRRERKDKQRSTNGTPIASGSSSPREQEKKPESSASKKLKDEPSLSNAGFEEGVEFIPFSFDDSDEEVFSRGDVTQGKGKEREQERDSTTSRRERSSVREWDRGKPRARSRERYGDSGSGTSNRNKRKYEMVFDAEDHYDEGHRGKRKAPWLDGLDLSRCKNVAEILHQEVHAFVDWISPTPEEDEVRGMVVQLISKTIQTSFPDAQVHAFGSYGTKLYLPHGDIDLVILSDSMAYSKKTDVLRAIARALKNARITSEVTIIAKAKVPIVKFVSRIGRFNVDISINQGNGLIAGQIINGFLKYLNPNEVGGKGSLALRSLVLVTKAFLNQRSLNEVYSGGLGSYSIVCLAVSFLQMHPKIRRGEIDPDKNLGVLVMEFFELYGCHFNYGEVGISVQDGGSYYNKRDRGWYDDQRWYLLSIEDPADPMNDIARNSWGIQKVRTAFAGAYNILTSTAYLRTTMISSRRSGRSVKLRGAYEPADLSILSTIMTITQETLNHRKIVQEVYNDEILRHRDHISSSINGNASGSLSNEGKHSTSSTKRSAHEVLVENESDSEGIAYHRNEEEEEGGRYDIGRLAPRKRQRTRMPDPSTTVFTTDEEEEGEYCDDPLSREDTGHRSGSDKRQGRLSRPPYGGDKRRSFWLSKSIGPSGGDDDYYDY